MRRSCAAGALVLFFSVSGGPVIPTAGAQDAAAKGEQLQAQCEKGRELIEQTYDKLTDAKKKGILFQALDMLVEIEEKNDWSLCIGVVEKALADIK